MPRTLAPSGRVVNATSAQVKTTALMACSGPGPAASPPIARAAARTVVEHYDARILAARDSLDPSQMRWGLTRTTGLRGDTWRDVKQFVLSVGPDGSADVIGYTSTMVDFRAS